MAADQLESELRWLLSARAAMNSFRLSAFGYRLFAVRYWLFAVLALVPALASAQESADERPAFSLSTSQVFTTKDAPNFYLTFRRIPTLDVRVYKVKDPFAFFSSLKDPHQLGSEEPYVPQNRSWIEKLADWKRWQRQEVQSFARRQVSHTYRANRRAATDKSEVAQRVTLNVNTFAQVPLLNPDQLVSSWRELLPNHRDPEVRRVPLDVKTPGIFVVEAVHDLIRAYTVVIVSDVGLVTKRHSVKVRRLRMVSSRRRCRTSSWTM
jgi:alpha-2-macroglobulin